MTELVGWALSLLLVWTPVVIGAAGVLLVFYAGYRGLIELFKTFVNHD